MPIYRYRCNKCGYEFDDMQPMDSVIERPCEQIIQTKSFPDNPCQGVASIKCAGIARRIPVGFSFNFNCDMSHLYRKGQ